MRCPRCQQENLASQKFCGECGTPLRHTNASGSPGASFAELERAQTEALGQQTATSEILRVISSSPTDVAPVFATIIRSAVQLSGARRGALLRFDGELVHLVAHHNQPAEALASLERAYPMRPGRAQVSGRAILSRAVAEIHDVRSDPEYLPGMAAEMELGSLLAVPMLRADGTPTGVIVIQRSEAGPFATGHVEWPVSNRLGRRPRNIPR